MESRAAELVELRKAEVDTAARQAHCSAVAKNQEEQLQVCLSVCLSVCVCVCVFLVSIARANRLTNAKTSVLSGETIASRARVCVYVFSLCVRASVF